MAEAVNKYFTTIANEKKIIAAKKGSCVVALMAVALFCPKLTVEMRLASIAYSLLVAGILLRQKRNWHGLLMGTAVTMDLSLVLYLEFQRAAIEKVAAHEISTLQAFHVGFSTGATLLYLPLVVLGLKAIKNHLGDSGRKWHKKLGIVAFVFRTLGFVFMFFFLK